MKVLTKRACAKLICLVVVKNCFSSIWDGWLIHYIIFFGVAYNHQPETNDPLLFQHHKRGPGPTPGLKDRIYFGGSETHAFGIYAQTKCVLQLAFGKQSYTTRGSEAIEIRMTLAASEQIQPRKHTDIHTQTYIYDCCFVWWLRRWKYEEIEDPRQCNAYVTHSHKHVYIYICTYDVHVCIHRSRHAYRHTYNHT